jgi:hypothetical protein
MQTPSKISVGIRPLERMFRLTSLDGLIAEAVLGARSQEPLDREYFTNIQRASSGDALRLTNPERGNYLIVDFENIIFVNDRYDSLKASDLNAFKTEFRVIWNALQSVAKIRDIRRIGLVCEYRFPLARASERLVSAITRLPASGYCDKFHLQFETRRGTGKGGLPDPSKDDFYNYIKTIYDSTADTDHPESAHYNANLDVQRYYAPVFNGNVTNELDALAIEFNRQQPAFMAEIQKLDLGNAKAA